MARNDGIDRTSARNQCVGEDAIGKIEGHNERVNATYTNPDIDPNRSWMNVHFKTPTGSYAEMFAQMEADGQISTRGLKPDADHYGEMVFDVNTAYFHNNGGYEYAKQFYAEAYKAAVDIVGDEKYILSAVMHADERNRPMSEALGHDVWHYHLHVVYIPVVEKQIKWTKRCKDPSLVGTVKETIHQVSASKKWQSDAVLDENGQPMRNEKGKVILNKSYSVLQDQFYDHMAAAGYTNIQRGEKGSTEQHLTTLQFKNMKEAEHLAEIQAMCAQAEAEEAEAKAAAEKAKVAEADAQQRALAAREDAVRHEQNAWQAEQHLKEIEDEKIRAQQAVDAATAKASEAQAKADSIEKKYKKEERQLETLVDSKEEVETFASKLGRPEDMLRKPKFGESIMHYCTDVVIPKLQQLKDVCCRLLFDLHKERGEHLQTKQQLIRCQRSLKQSEDKAKKYDQVENALGREQIDQIIADSEEKAHERKKHRREKDFLR